MTPILWGGWSGNWLQRQIFVRQCAQGRQEVYSFILLGIFWETFRFLITQSSSNMSQCAASKPSACG